MSVLKWSKFWLYCNCAQFWTIGKLHVWRVPEMDSLWLETATDNVIHGLRPSSSWAIDFHFSTKKRPRDESILSEAPDTPCYAWWSSFCFVHWLVGMALTLWSPPTPIGTLIQPLNHPSKMLPPPYKMHLQSHIFMCWNNCIQNIVCLLRVCDVSNAPQSRILFSKKVHKSLFSKISHKIEFFHI